MELKSKEKRKKSALEKILLSDWYLGLAAIAWIVFVVFATTFFALTLPENSPVSPWMFVATAFGLIVTMLLGIFSIYLFNFLFVKPIFRLLFRILETEKKN